MKTNEWGGNVKRNLVKKVPARAMGGRRLFRRRGRNSTKG